MTVSARSDTNARLAGLDYADKCFEMWPFPRWGGSGGFGITLAIHAGGRELHAEPAIVP